MSTESVRKSRAPLSRDRVLRAAVELADEGGLASLSMRRLGERLGVEAMSLYKHVANKEDLLDGIVDIVVGEIDLPAPGDDWRTAMRRRAVSARAMFRRHPWALLVMETRTTPGATTFRYHDAVLGALRADGFTVALAAHAFAVLDSLIFGFCLQEQNLPFDESNVGEMAESMMDAMPADEYPHLAEIAVEHVMQPGYDFANEFDFGLELILDGLERLRG